MGKFEDVTYYYPATPGMVPLVNRIPNGYVRSSDYEALERVDMLAEAGLCQLKADGKHAYLKDIRQRIALQGINGGLVPLSNAGAEDEGGE